VAPTKILTALGSVWLTDQMRSGCKAHADCVKFHPCQSRLDRSNWTIPKSEIIPILCGFGQARIVLSRLWTKWL